MVDVDLSGPFKAVAAGGFHSLGLKANGSIVAWGSNFNGQSIVPAPNSRFVAVAASRNHSLGLKADGSIVAWGCGNQLNYDQCNVPAPNSEFLAIAAGEYHSIAIRRETPLGDLNGDVAVDLIDYAFLVDALLGPFANPRLPNWFLFNFDGDFDLDLADLAEFQNSFGLERLETRTSSF